MIVDTRGQKILIVEHDRTVLEMLQIRLEVAGYHTLTARTGCLALEVLSPEPTQPDPGQVSLRVTGPGGHSFCDLADLSPDVQVAAARRLTGTCEALLVPSGGRSAPAPELLAAARPTRLIVSDAGGRLARDLPAGDLARTSEEGDIVLPL